MIKEATDDKQVSVESLADKYLTFKLGDEEYGITILKVQRIIQMQTITPVPKTPEYMRGVINLRGKIIPVISLRNKFGMEQKEDSETTCVIVVQIGLGGTELTIGVVIDQVSEVIFIEGEDIQETPQFGQNVETEFILGMAKLERGVVMLLDINSVLSSTEVLELAKIK